MRLEAFEIERRDEINEMIIWINPKTGERICERTRNVQQGIQEVNILKQLGGSTASQLVEYELKGTAFKVYTRYIEGVSLSKAMEDASMKDMILTNLARIFHNAIACVKYVHDRGILHRDIKPENMMIDAYLNVTLVDFATAIEKVKVLDENTLVGTLQYASPEAVFKPWEFDESSDYYSVGKVFETLLSHQAFVNDLHLECQIRDLTQIQKCNRRSIE